MATTEGSLSIADVEADIGRFGAQMTGQYADIDRVLREARREYPVGLTGYRFESVGDPVAHRHLLSALGYIRSALLNTHHRFEMVTGSDRVLHTLEGEFRTMLKHLINGRSMPARVIVVDGQPGKFQDIALEHPDALRVVSAQSRDGGVSHFFTSDSAVSRDEALHPPLSDVMRSDMLPAEYYPNNHSKAHVLQTLFAGYWKKLTGECEPEPQKRRWWPFGRK